MSIDLTEEQRQIVMKGDALRLPAPEIGGEVVLLRADQYDSILELLEDDRAQKAVLAYSMKQAAKVALESETE